MCTDYLIVIDADAASAAEALQISGAKLQEAGLVKEGFAQACIERESAYPTGLPLGEPVAIPHTTCEYVLETGLCVLRLGRPVEFGRMDDPGRTIPVRMIVNLALAENEHKADLLQTLISALADDGFVRSVLAGPNGEAKRLIQDRIGQVIGG